MTIEEMSSGIDAATTEEQLDKVINEAGESDEINTPRALLDYLLNVMRAACKRADITGEPLAPEWIKSQEYNKSMINAKDAETLKMIFAGAVADPDTEYGMAVSYQLVQEQKRKLEGWD